MGHFLQITIARKTRPFLKKNYTISPDCKLQNRATSFLQITIARKTGPFLKKNYRISRDREMKKWATFCKLRSQEKLDHFSRKTIRFLVIANCRIGPLASCKLRSQQKLDHFSRKTIEFLVIAKCRNGPLSANYDRKKN